MMGGQASHRFIGFFVVASLAYILVTACRTTEQVGDATTEPLSDPMADAADSLPDTDDIHIDDAAHEEDIDVVSDACIPTCPEWKECGEDGCGGSCGECEPENGCSRIGVCVPYECATDVLVPEGEFVMGADVDEGYLDEQPEHIVWISEFFVSTCEITNWQWRACVEDGSCAEPWDFSSQDRTEYYLSEAYRDFPVIWIEWEKATAFCEWAGGRLPTEAEWEKAARGGCELEGDVSLCDDPEDERRFPWGNDMPTCEHMNLESCIGDTDRVGSYPDGASPYGVLDLLGNVSEWVFDYYSETYYRDGGPPWSDPVGPDSAYYRVIRGGNYWDIPMTANNTYRATLIYNQPSGAAGLRCVY